MRRPLTLRAHLTLFFASAVLGTLLLYGGAVTAILVWGEWRERLERHSAPAEATKQADEEGLFDEALQALGAMALTAPLAALGAAVLGSALARRAMAPLRDASERARAARASKLDLSLPVRGNGDEWDQLASTLNELLADARASFERIRAFTSDAAHEFRTPLTVILGETEVSLRRERTPEEYRRSLEIVFEETQRLARLVDELLQLARSDAGARVMNTEPLDLYALAREALEQTRRHVAAQARSLTLELVGATTPIHGNPILLTRLLENLLDNARRHARSHIRVEIITTGSEVLTTVSDDGVGVDAAFLPRLFERFARADVSRSTEGTGLGLALSRTIAEAHGGALAYQRRGEESHFTFRLPLSSGPAGEPVRSLPAIPGKTTT
ncbi:sensor histidine kinase [Myxococcus hansupus]|uniref:histidine kinase n=1 Tax=Pseudomyxococcus hansupus TaxID=1297742 RepID=A0A0H4WXL0_9BACT|nr:ATP-binding protein [Myxococcus hansupus]AKQ66070.1 sensor histidine kinase [Myxococcus hansupus]